MAQQRQIPAQLQAFSDHLTDSRRVRQHLVTDSRQFHCLRAELLVRID